MDTGKKRILSLLLAGLTAILMLVGCTPEDKVNTSSVPAESNSSYAAEGVSSSIKETAGGDTDEAEIKEDGRYSQPEEVAEYLHLYGHLPENFITKSEARELGWESSKGNLWDVTDQMSIGGDRFGNYEGLLPSESGRVWYECDVNYSGGYRGAERILYSNDGLIYYTDDHYETFTQLY